MLRFTATRVSAVAAARGLGSRLVSDTALGEYGTRVFSPDEEAKTLSAPLRAALAAARTSGKGLSKAHANELAAALHKWAAARGAVAFAHQFYPMRGRIPGEKHDTFLTMDFKTGTLSEGFTGSQLLHGETDGSSFPNGGLRATHEAAAYTSWDFASMPYVRGTTLMLPSAMVSWSGEPLDEKTPLLRSEAAVAKQAARVLALLEPGTTPSRVITKVGWEQEFFVVDAGLYTARPDLVNTGRTLLGAPPPLGQASSAHYFARMPTRVKEMLSDAQREMWAVGISCATIHNEVAPAQHETAPIFSVTASAADQNLLAMDILTEAAQRHELAVLFHEKPFKGHNGSGKHNNWGINLESGANVFAPGDAPADQRRFTVFTAALMYALATHGNVVRVGVATAGNDHRLGAHEAPPAIMSLYTGERLAKHLAAVAAGGSLAGYSVGAGSTLDLGAASLSPIRAGIEDRNRTAPFPFVGNRFEFRAVGANQNIMMPLTMVHTAFADGLRHIADRVAAGGVTLEQATAATIAESMHVVFNGNGYSAEWPVEAARRGLANLQNTPAALDTLSAKVTVDLFARHGIVSPAGLAARQTVMFENYTHTVRIEAATMLNMLRDSVLPACVRDCADGRGALPGALGAFVKRKNKLYSTLARETEKLEAAIDGLKGDNARDEAFAALAVTKQMAATRAVADQVETLVPASLWPFPKYDALFYSHHSQA